MRAATGEIVAYIDDDAIADTNWLRHVSAEFEDPKVMAVVGRAIPPPSGAQQGVAFFDLGPNRRCVDLATPKWFEMASFGGIGIGCNMAFRRSASVFWRGFDERLGRGAPIDGGEENHAFTELISQGFRVVYAPSAVVFHRGDTFREDGQRRYIKDLRTASAYLMMLLFESDQKIRVLRYLVEAVCTVKRPWRMASAGESKYSCSGWERLKAYLGGCVCYFRCRRNGAP